MSLLVKLDNAVRISNDFGVCIAEDSPIWSMSPNEAMMLLKRANALVPHVKGVEITQGILRGGVSYPGVPDEDILTAAFANPFLSDADKDVCRARLAMMQAANDARARRRLPDKTMREQVFQRDGYRCRYCGNGLLPGEAVSDHIFPYIHGGPTILENLATACAFCNARKRDRTPSEAGMTLLPIGTTYVDFMEMRKELQRECHA